MAAVRGKTRMGTMTWIACGFIGAVFLCIAANAYALELGAAHHDAFCPEHGWAV